MDVKVMMITVGMLGLVLGVLFVINHISVYPKIYLLRFLDSFNKNKVKIGDYATDISRVEIKRTILIEDEDIYNPLPSTTVTLYGLKDIKTIQPLIFFIHGGGWSMGDESDLSVYLKLLASNGYLVAGANYALAPEHPYPTSTQQLMMSLNHLYEHADKYHIDPHQIFIAGNSSGAHLASQLGVILSNDDYAYQLNLKPKMACDDIKGAILFNGVYDFYTTKETRFPLFSRFMWSYTHHKDYMNCDRLDELSTLKQLTKDFPETFITAGNKDPLYDQSLAMTEALKALEVTCEALIEYDAVDDLNHDFMFNLNHKASKEVYGEVSKFLKNRSI